jgi:putative transcriptional regulator
MKAYHYKTCGLDYIYLKNGFTRHKTAYGEGLSIENVFGLYDAILRTICMSKPYLRGQDVRFMRKRLEVTQSVLAGMLGVDSQSVARWEKDKCEMPVPSQRLLRLLCMEKLDKKSPIHSFIDGLNTLEDMENKIVFEEKDDRWARAA